MTFVWIPFTRVYFGERRVWYFQITIQMTAGVRAAERMAYCHPNILVSFYSDAGQFPSHANEAHAASGVLHGVPLPYYNIAA